MIEQICDEKTPSITYIDKKYSSCNNNDESPETENSEEFIEQEKTIKFSGYELRKKFAIIMNIISYIHEKLIANSQMTNSSNFYCTRRSLYYELKNKLVGRFVENQRTIDQIVNQISMMLDCGPWEIGEFLLILFF